MTASKSNTNKYMWINFKQKLFDTKIFIMLVIFNLMALPYLFLLSYLNRANGLLIVPFFAFALIFGAGIFIPLLKFSYLNQRAKVDMVYSLPLTRKQQFLSDYFAGLTLYLIPYIVQMILIQVLPFFLRMEENSQHNSYTITRFFYKQDRAFFFTLVVMFMMILLYTLTVFVMSCTGSLFEAISASVYCNFLIPLLFWTINNNIIGSLFSIDSNEFIYDLLKRTSPIGGLFYLFTDLYRITWTNIFNYLIPVLITTLVLYFLSYHIQTKRKAEDVSKPFVTRLFYYFVLGSFIFIIGTILFGNGTGYINLVVVLSIIYTLIELVSNRGFIKLKISFIRYGITLSAFILFLFVYTKTEGFGLVYRTTKPSNLNSIEYAFDGVLIQTDYHTNTNTINDKENMEILLEFQNRQLKKHKINDVNIERSGSNKYQAYKEFATVEYAYTEKEENFIYEAQSTFEMIFDVKAGFDYSRSYDVSFEDLILLAPIELSDSYIDAKIDSLINNNYIYAYISDLYSTRSLDLSTSKRQLITSLLEALRLDLKEISLENYLKPKTSTGVVLTFSNDYKVDVNPDYKHTIAYLKKNNLWIDKNETNYQSLLAISNIFIVAPEMDEENAASYYTSKEDYHSLIVKNKVTELTDDVITLLNNAAYHYVTDEPSYYLYVNQYRYVIPAKFADVAARVDDYFSK